MPSVGKTSFKLSRAYVSWVNKHDKDGTIKSKRVYVIANTLKHAHSLLQNKFKKHQWNMSHSTLWVKDMSADRLIKYPIGTIIINKH